MTKLLMALSIMATSFHIAHARPIGFNSDPSLGEAIFVKNYKSFPGSYSFRRIGKGHNEQVYDPAFNGKKNKKKRK